MYVIIYYSHGDNSHPARVIGPFEKYEDAAMEQNSPNSDIFLMESTKAILEKEIQDTEKQLKAASQMQTIMTLYEGFAAWVAKMLVDGIPIGSTFEREVVDKLQYIRFTIEQLNYEWSDKFGENRES